MHATFRFPKLLLVAVAWPLAGCGAAVVEADTESQEAGGALVEPGAKASGPPPSGAGPTEGAALGPCTSTAAMISDGEQSPNQTNVVEGRGGYWYTYADASGTTITPTPGAQGGTFEMSPGGANGTARAARMSGAVADADIVFAGMGMNFMDPKGAYDARRYQGIAFYAKKGSAGGTGQVRLKVPDRRTDPDGQVCRECFNDFGASFEVTTEWQLFVFPFADMAQLPDWGRPRPRSIDPEALYGIQFQVMAPGRPFDIWVDEIQFVGCR